MYKERSRFTPEFEAVSLVLDRKQKKRRLFWSKATGPAAPTAADASFAESDQLKGGDRITMSQSQNVLLVPGPRHRTILGIAARLLNHHQITQK